MMLLYPSISRSAHKRALHTRSQCVLRDSIDGGQDGTRKNVTSKKYLLTWLHREKSRTTVLAARSCALAPRSYSAPKLTPAAHAIRNLNQLWISCSWRAPRAPQTLFAGKTSIFCRESAILPRVAWEIGGRSYICKSGTRTARVTYSPVPLGEGAAVWRC